jgi:RimJ/RimL family protein N-acetyltransferase
VDYSRYFWQGEKTRLRPLRSDDAEWSFEASLDSPARRQLQLGIELPTSVEAQRDVLAKYADCADLDGVIVMAIEDLAGNSVGAISWHSRNPKNGTFSFGISVAAPYRRSGYAEDAARILFRYAFHERRFQKCNSACTAANAESIRLHEKLGFVEEGRRRRQFFMDGEYFDDVLFGLTIEEFDANEAARAASD